MELLTLLRKFSISLWLVIVLSIAGNGMPGRPAAARQDQLRHIYLALIVRMPTGVDFLNNYRALANLSAVAANSSWAESNLLHSQYMIKNNLLTHDEVPGNPWTTIEGLAAAQSSLLLTSSDTGLEDGSVITKWMSGPFHALPVLQPRLKEIGYGAYREADGGVQTGAGVDVYRGINILSPATYPVFYPANGQVMPVGQYSGGEVPDPLSACAGYTAPSGPPILAQFGDGFMAVNVSAHAFLQGSANRSSPPGTSGELSIDLAVNLDHCIYTETSYTHSDPQQQAMGRSVLDNQDAVVIIPRYPLTAGQSYIVQMTVNGQAYTWNFTVGPNPGGAINAQIAAQPITTTQDAPGVLPLPPLAPVDQCTQAIIQTLVAENRPALSFTQTSQGGEWVLDGISGRLETWRANPYKDGPVFDLVQVFYQHNNLRYPLWTVAGVKLPPYYSVYDSASYEHYQEHVGKGAPYYVSFVEGVKTRDELRQLFAQPGAHRLNLSLSGAFVHQGEVDWEACEPKYSDFCTLARFFEGMQIIGPSNDLIQNGTAPASYFYGFLIWPIRITGQVDLYKHLLTAGETQTPCSHPTPLTWLPDWRRKFVPW